MTEQTGYIFIMEGVVSQVYDSLLHLFSDIFMEKEGN